MINCPNCEAELEENLKFCSKCGTKISDIQNISQEDNDEISCPKCSAELSADTIFCTECGTKTTDINAGTSETRRPTIDNVNQKEPSVDMELITNSSKGLAKGLGGFMKKTAKGADKKWEKRKEQKKEENEIEDDKKIEKGLIKKAVGTDGQLELYEHKIVIVRKGKFSLVQYGLQGDRELLINQITSIQLKPSSDFLKGIIRFTFAGSSKKSWSQDENSIKFSTSQEPDFVEMKEMIEAKMLENQGLGNTSKKDSDLDELEKLAEFKEKGIISEEEFQAKKKQILGL